MTLRSEIEIAEWKRKHGKNAALEGWCISDAGLRTDNDRWQIQRLDGVSEIEGAPQLDEDAQAWDIVMFRTAPLYDEARAFIKEFSPGEWIWLCKHARGDISSLPGDRIAEIIEVVLTAD